MPKLPVILLALMMAPHAAATPAKEMEQVPFPLPEALSPAVHFWVRVFTEVDSASGFVHDRRKLDVIYETLYLNPDAPPRRQNKAIEKALGEYRKALLALASGKRDMLSSFEARAQRAWGQQASAEDLEQAAEHLRFQRGQSDRILKGLVRYDRWKGTIQAILRRQGLPVDLAALPLVESSYNPRAVSKAGAVGLWQFMPVTARRYLRVDGRIDERLDPMKSSEAAALLLKQNYAVLNTWPLAITAYNHGIAGVRRAVRETGTDDLGEIAKRYETERFGFASRNFYAAFLAAVDVSRHPMRYFRTYRQDARDRIGLVTPAFLPVDVLVEGFGIEKERLRSLNPALHHDVWNGERFVPKGSELNLPATFVQSWAQEQLALLGEHFGFSAQRPSPYYEVRRGDSLSEIAERHGTSAATLLTLNRLRSADEIHAGQTLRVPLTAAPKPLGVGSAALLSAQRVRGGIDGEAVDLPRMIAALAGQDVQLDRDAPGQSKAQLLASGACRAGDAEESVATQASLAGNPAETSTLLAAVQPDLAADPADYGVATDGTIEIQIDETLGHYADWLQQPSDRIRALNGLKKDIPLIVGRRLKLDFSTVSAGAFEDRRIAHHKSRQLRYFGRHRITGVIEHPIIAGDNLWLLAVEQYGVPLWLLRQYNPDVNVDTILSLGSILFVPFVETLPDESACAVAQMEAAPGGDVTRPSAEPGKGTD
jgi:membrane-bound lytic murein transglycosylase D